MPQVQPEQARKGIPVSVVIRKSGYAYTWICKVKVFKKPCNHTQAASTEEDAKKAYAAHKKEWH